MILDRAKFHRAVTMQLLREEWKKPRNYFTNLVEICTLHLDSRCPATRAVNIVTRNDDKD